MCIVFWSTPQQGPYSLIVASNRDEFLARPTVEAGWHDWSPPSSSGSSESSSSGNPERTASRPMKQHRILYGLDLIAGGTWFGISLPPTVSSPSQSSADTATQNPGSSSPTDKRPTRPSMRFATLTNFTETLLPPPPSSEETVRPSRGNLVRDFLDLDLHLDSTSSSSAPSTSEPASEPTRGGGKTLETFLAEVEEVKGDYAGFNLLIGEITLPPGPDPPPSPSSSTSPAPETNPRPAVRLGYISNRESTSTSPTSHQPKVARILARPSLKDAEGDRNQVVVHGLSNATLEVEEGEEEWPKVKSGAKAVEKVVREVCLDRAQAQEGVSKEDESGDEKVREERLVKGLYEALSTPHPSPISHRTHLRHTVLVQPLLLDPLAPIPAIPPPFPPVPSSTPSSTCSGRKEGDKGARWYATRVQTILLVGRDGKVVFREREGFGLDGEGGVEWKGRERRFEFDV
ncbi:hypothetical protein JCM11641_001017 [Rhodosporidiobolus odoratus]